MNYSEAVELAPSNEALWWFDPRPGETLRRALERALREAITGGSLRPGVQLPASRKLAADLRVSRGVVTDAYDQLIAQGFLLARGRTPPVVAELPRPREVQRPALPAPPRIRYDLTATTPDVGLFPVRRWLTTALQAGQTAPAAMLDYRDAGGEARLRETLVNHLGRTRGVVADPEQIVVTQGTAQAVDVLLRALRARGARSILVEDPSHTGHQARIRAAAMTLVAREVDAEGLLVDDLEGDAVLVTPAHQFPTGSVLGAQRRSRLLDWAHTADALVIEDDYDAEFRYDREPVRALQGMAPDRVVQLGTVSKTLAPALRLGWMVVPPDLLADVLFHKAVVDEASPALNQLTLAAFLQNGDYDRQVRRARVVYRGRRDALVAELIEAFPELEVSGIEAGLHVILRLPDTANDAAVAQAGLRHGLRVSALSSFCVQRRDVKGLVIGYGRLHESAVGPAVRQLQAIISSAREAIFTEPSA